MNIETEIPTKESAQPQGNLDLLKLCSSGMNSYLRKAKALHQLLSELEAIGDARTADNVARLRRQLDNFEPSVTMIGQVKAGKTSLVNAMVGWPNLLPADVNPWTSVVTSLHLNPVKTQTGNSAVFRFFDDKEWGRLVDKGGRIGELASRAGADEELESVRVQIETMREKSRARLGRRFELLLGQEHDYGYFDQDLIERYVCLGDDFDDDDSVSDTQGRFADITKSADLFFHRPELRNRMCIRDTPGVNDTFMMREQITIRAIRDSRICVVVLSAHQALSSVDMALIRLISNIKSREVIIYVNRIDELSDPATQVPEIRNSIRETLKNHDGPADATIVFGSAYWANKALSDSLESLSKDSSLSLVNWAEQELQYHPDSQSPAEMIWTLSGLPALYSALSERIAEGPGQEVIEKVARSAVNLANGLQVGSKVVTPTPDVVPFETATKDGITKKLDEIEAKSLAAMQAELKDLIDAFQVRIDRSHQSFLERATASLITHLERNGENEIWQYDPAGLRVLLRSAYKIFGSRTQRSIQSVFDNSAADICDLYARSFGNLGTEFSIEVPRPPRVPPPVLIGQTIALDMQGSWWRSWWQRRRAYKAFASNFYQMIMEETDPIVVELKGTMADSIKQDATDTLLEFLADQRAILMGVIDQIDAGPEKISEVPGLNTHADRKKRVETTLTTLNQYVA